MKHLYLFGLFFSLPFFCFSQGEWNKWCFGEYITLDFNSGNPIKIANNAMWAPEGTISVSDSLGNLLFYSDGSKVWDRNNNVMPNGTGLHGIWNVEKAVFAVPALINDSTYYLFTVGNDGTGAYWGLEYSIIDMKMNGGYGAVVPSMKNIPVNAADSSYNYLYGIRHHNNRDVWIVTKQHPCYPGTTFRYMSFLLTPSGLDTVPVISNTLIPNSGSQPGMLRISPDGTKFFGSGVSTFSEFYHFNDETGVISPLFRFTIQDPNGQSKPVYAEFSRNNHYLYVTGGASYPNSLFQFDAMRTDSLQFQKSQVFLGTGCFAMQLAPDGKIYLDAHSVNMPYGVVDSMHVINNPDLGGVACNFQKNVLSLTGQTTGNTSIPQFLQKYNLFIRNNDVCIGDTVIFTSIIWPPADTIQWNFGDPTSGISNTSILPNPSHYFSIPGNYSVSLYVRHNDNRTDTVWKTVHVYAYPTPNPNLGQDRTICNGDSSTFDAGTCSGCTYLWKDLGSGLTVGTAQTFKTGLSGIYAVTVTNISGCTGTDTVQLFTTPIPAVTNNPLSKSICSSESTNIALTSSVPGTNFHWTASLTSGNITGFSADSGLIINQVLTNSLPTPGVVTYHITPKAGSCPGTPGDFAVTVIPGDSVKVSITASTNNVCSGTLVTFNAAPTNPGVTPVYLWKVNGINSGTNSPTFSYSPLNGDVVTCILTSSLTICISNNPATSNSITMVVNPNLPVSVAVTASQNPVCSGTSVTFTANPVNGGSSPSYQWKVNGIGVGTNNPVYSYSPNNGDIVLCDLTSNIACPISNPATSNSITMIVNSNLPAGVTITATSNPFCPGSSVTFTATPSNGGSTPAYQWKVNGNNVGINSSTYTYNPINNDSIRCVMTSNLSCVTGNPASSNKIIMSGTLAPIVSFTSCFDTITTINAKPIKLKGGIPLGGTYSGPGVNSLTGVFTPSLAGVGTHTITYTYTNAALCSAIAHAHIINYPLSIVNCGSPITDIRDNKVYPTVQIGSQCWLATNLNYGTILTSSQDQRDNCQTEKYCYNDNPINCINQGGLYQWDELMLFDETPADQGFCPPGWHIPTENEWNILFANYINSGFAGSPLKYSGYSGFNALLSGARHINKGWDFLGFATFFWSSTARSDNKAWAHGMNDPDPSVSSYPASRVNAFSVRCLKD